MENNTQLKEMIRSMVIDILQGQKQEMASSQPIKQAPRGQVEPGVFDTVDEAIQAAKAAQARFEDCTLATREKVIADIRAAMRPRVQELAQKTVDETGMGRVADKVLKLNLTLNKTPGVEDLVTECETGDNGMTLYELSAYGVIGAITPSTKVIGAGAGNPPAFVDETADIKKAAQDIVLGASLDNNILCIAEKSVVAMRQIEPQLVQEMVKAGCILLENQQDIQRLVDLTVLPNGTPNKKFVGKNASVILDAAHIPYNGDPRLIIMRAPKNHPFAVIEMLMPILPVVTVDSFDEGLDVCLMLEAGLHHTATMHSLNMERLNRMARKMKTSIFVKNGPSYAGLGFSGEGTTTFTIATPTGESTTSARCFARRRRCCLTTGFNIR